MIRPLPNKKLDRIYLPHRELRLWHNLKRIFRLLRKPLKKPKKN